MSHRRQVSRELVALVVGLVGLVNSESALAQDTPPSEEARAHFHAGVEHLTASSPDYQKAYDEFSLAYAATPSWKVLGNLGIAAMKLERDGEALEAFEQYIREGRPSLEASELAQFEADIKLLKESVAWVSLELPADAVELRDSRQAMKGETVVNKYKARNSVLRVGVRQGLHQFVLTTKSGREFEWTVDLKAGERSKHKFDESVVVVDSAPASRPVPTGVYVGLGGTVLFAGSAAAFGVLALNKNKKYEEINDGTQVVEAEKAQNSAKTFGLVSDIMWGATAVTAGVTAVLYFTRPEIKEASHAFRIVPAVGTNAWALSVSGEF